MKEIFFVTLFVIIIQTVSPSNSVKFANNLDWWENGNFYQIYPRSFKDSDGDGIGDLNGITEKLPYLKELGVTGTWLSPIFNSPMYDFGYDISNYTSIHPDYGTMADFEKLSKRCKELGLRLILDLVPNHSSDEHEWFQKSIKRDPEYENFYVWHPGKVDNVTGKRVPPSNWLSVFHNSAWDWNDQRKEYYLHQFSVKQPDLNFREPKVRQKIEEIINFWLGKGVSGFRVDAVPHFYEISIDKNGNYPDEPLSGQCTNDPTNDCYLNHIYTKHLNETFELVYKWRNQMDQYKKVHGGDTRILMLEVSADLGTMMRYYGDGKRKGSRIPFNFELLFQVTNQTKASQIKNIVDSWLLKMPSDEYANWVFGNHDVKRIAARLGTQKVDLFNILIQTLPGISVTYYGEEIGMNNVFISWNDTVDISGCNTNESVYENFSRDPARTPFQWSSAKNAGFSNGNTTWLPISTDYRLINADIQNKTKRSHLNIYKDLIALRNVFTTPDYHFQSTYIGDDIFLYQRQGNDTKPYVVVLNIGSKSHIISLKNAFSQLPDRAKVVISSINNRYQKGDIINTHSVLCEPSTGIVLIDPITA